ncbi:hypothetical protein KIPB_009614 [Kipferlia bialata]|uniref:Uncharacterized protein n=1 Tax=Kipferlia bialata TaxID=797122 RepID=A0A9K3GME2_9EUKA|nr:hypothetical protein KIPB_009614 [Kipferlia bialata]|eukprot:g9614.t1
MPNRNKSLYHICRYIYKAHVIYCNGDGMVTVAPDLAQLSDPFFDSLVALCPSGPPAQKSRAASNIWHVLEHFGFRPTLHGSMYTVYATPASDCDITVEASLPTVMSTLQDRCRYPCMMIGTDPRRRHVKVFLQGDHVDIVCAAENDGVQKRNLLINMAIRYPWLPLVKRMLAAFARECDVPIPMEGLLKHACPARHGSQLFFNLLWSREHTHPLTPGYGSLHKILTPGHAREEWLRPVVFYNTKTQAPRSDDQVSPLRLTRGMLLRWATYNTTHLPPPYDVAKTGTHQDVSLPKAMRERLTRLMQ